MRGILASELWKYPPYFFFAPVEQNMLFLLKQAGFIIKCFICPDGVDLSGGTRADVFPNGTLVLSAVTASDAGKPHKTDL